jgi:hypothetical protein
MSCSKEEQSLPDPYAQLCTPQSFYYFRGIVDNQSKCWNYSIINQNNKCQLYSGSSIYKIDDTVVAYYWDHGIQKSINNDSFESIIISSKTKYDPTTCSRDQFFNSFQTGVYQIRSSTGSNDYPDFEVYYTLPDSTFYVSSVGKQYDSQIELVNIVNKPDAKNICDTVILSYRLKCTVYNPYGIDSLRLSIGELRVIQMRLYESGRVLSKNSSPRQSLFLRNKKP